MKITHKLKSVAYEQATASLLQLHGGSRGHVEFLSSASPPCIAGNYRCRSDIFNISKGTVRDILLGMTALVRSYLYEWAG